MMEPEVAMLKDLSLRAKELVTEVLKNHHVIAGIDSTNPNALSIFIKKGGQGVKVDEALSLQLQECLIYGCVPANDGYWISFFPHKVENIKLDSQTEEVKSDD